MRLVRIAIPLVLAAVIALWMQSAVADGGSESYARPSVDSKKADNKTDEKKSGSFFGLFGSDDEDKDADELEAGRAIDSYRHGNVDGIVQSVMRQKAFGLLRTNGHGLVPDRQLVGYVQEILDRIVAASPVPNLNVRVYIRASRAFIAEAYPGGLVSVSMGLLRDVSTEDELAFVLAHELGHLLFRHHESDWLKNAQYKVFFASSLLGDAADVYAAYSGNTEMSKKLDRVAKISKGFYEVTDHALNPAWNRKQEVLADKIGLDLLIRAGYKPAAGMVFFDKQKAYEDGLEKERLAERERERKQAEEEVESAVERKNFFSALTTAVGQGVSQVGDSLKDDLGATHYPADKRKADLNEYLNVNYKKTKDPLFRKVRRKTAIALPWGNWQDASAKDEESRFIRSYRSVEEASELLNLSDATAAAKLLSGAIYDRTRGHSFHRHVFFKVRAAQEQSDRAWTNLKLALDGPATSLPIYKAAIDLRLKRKDAPEALKILERARQDLDDPVSLWPLRIAVLTKLQREKEIRSLMLECQAESEELGKACKSAHKEAKAEQAS